MDTIKFSRIFTIALSYNNISFVLNVPLIYNQVILNYTFYIDLIIIPLGARSVNANNVIIIQQISKF